MENLNIPSYSRLIVRDNLIKAVQCLFDYISRWKQEADQSDVTSETIRNIVSLTQDEYDALSTKDANTLYVIVES